MPTSVTIKLSTEIAEQAKVHAKSNGLSLEAYLEYLIAHSLHEGRQSDPDLGDLSDAEFADLQAAIAEGQRQAELGNVRPADTVLAELRAKHAVPR